MARGGDIPEGLEVLDETGVVIAAGDGPQTPTPTLPDPPVRRRWPLVLAAMLAIGLAAVALRILLDDDEPATTPPEPLGILQHASIDFATSTLATYPLFDRAWNDDLVALTDAGLTVIDLGTGTQRAIRLPDDARVDHATVIDGELTAFDGSTVYRITDAGVEELYRLSDAPGLPGSALIGGFLTRWNEITETVFFDASTGEPVDPGPSRHVAIVGDRLFAQRGERIVSVDATTATNWTSGEMLIAGSGTVLWRQCREPDDCRYWAGTADDPRALELDPIVAAPILVDTAAMFGTARNDLFSPTLVSPSGRFLWLLEADSNRFDFDLHLVDLVSGDIADVDDAAGLATFSPDESVIVSDHGGLVALDTASGERVTIAIDGGVRDVLFVPREPAP